VFGGGSSAQPKQAVPRTERNEKGAGGDVFRDYVVRTEEKKELVFGTKPHRRGEVIKGGSRVSSSGSKIHRGLLRE